jgi:hypothetical protein
MIYQYYIEWVNELPQTPFSYVFQADSKEEADKLLQEKLQIDKDKHFNHKILSTIMENKKTN